MSNKFLTLLKKGFFSFILVMLFITSLNNLIEGIELLFSMLTN